MVIQARPYTGLDWTDRYGEEWMNWSFVWEDIWAGRDDELKVVVKKRKNSSQVYSLGK